MSSHYATIMVALDGSATAADAIPFAVMLARRSDPAARLELVHVHEVGVLVENAPMVDGRWEDDRAAEMDDAVRVVADRTSRETGLRVSAVTLRGAAAASIAQHAAEHAADIIVMTTHGRSGFNRMWFGSVAERVIHSATTPVLVVRATAPTDVTASEPLFRHVLLPIDREASGRKALARALAAGTPGRTTYTLLTVVPLLPRLPQPVFVPGTLLASDELAVRVATAKAMLERVAAPARHGELVIECLVLPHDRTATAILEVAEGAIDLIVLPVHARSGLSWTLLGSVVDKVMRGATVPLLLFRASAATSRTSLEAA
jgi:nucleotide-binding universal stress UspA family protein